MPFAVGESMQYELRARWGIIRGSGTATLEVEALDTIHGHEAYRLVFGMRGGIAVFRVNDRMTSWLDTDQLYSRRFHQRIDQTTYKRDRTLEFFPDSMRYVQVGAAGRGGDLASAFPLDDVSFLYHVRSIPLNAGETYRFDRYYKAEGNPIVVTVLRRERIRIPAGEFNAIVVEPRIRSGGLFGDDGRAVVWLSDDDRRIILKLEAKVSIATLTMELSSLQRDQ